MEDIIKTKERLYNTGRVLPDKCGGAPESNRTHGLFTLCNNHIKPDDIVCEVGSFAGVSSEVFALYAKEVHCIDPWIAYCDIPNNDDFIMAEKEFDVMVECRGNVVKKKGVSKDVALEYPNGFFDLLYIDAVHDDVSVLTDIETWLPKLKPTGIMSGHDFDLPGVKKAVLTMFSNKKIATFSDNSWLVYIKEDGHV